MPHRRSARRAGVFPALLSLLLLTCLAGCGSWRLSQLWEKPAAPQTQGRAALDAARSADDGPPLAPPRLPPGLASPSPANMPPATPPGDVPALPYTARLESPADPDLLAPWRDASLLLRLAASPPEDAMGLDFRMDKDVAEARRVMESFGYYDGTVQREVNTAVSPVQVVLRLEPGPRYVLGRTAVCYAGAAPVGAPRALDDVGLEAGAAAVATEVLEAVRRIPEALRARGYPLAKTEDVRYVLNTERRTLDVSVSVDPGPLAAMGAVRVTGTSSVDPDYFSRLRPWEDGAVWDENVIQGYRDTLSRQGLFRTVTMTPVPADPPRRELSGAELYDVLTTVADAPQKTVGAGLNYESDRGAGGQAFWEHRNLFSGGERLRLETTLWRDRQDARLRFRKPAFLRRDQDFTAESWLRNEDTDAYRQKAVWAGAGLERRLGRRWGLTVRGTGEAGELEDPLRPKNAYQMFGLPVTLRYDATDSLLNPEKGLRAALTATPYAGRYGEDFTAGYTRLDLSAYHPLGERTVLAARLAGGSLLRGDAWRVPASIRYYAGGGGSVRGYAYQSLGPLDSGGNPLGGASFLEAGLEARIKITKDIGIVPFLDGGNVYASAAPDLFQDGMQWGAGLGLRYYTAIGPLRLDVAVPLNPREADTERFFVYISIGQSF